MAAPEIEVTPRELASMCRQMATLLGVGVDILRILEVIREEAPNPLLRDALRAVEEDLRMGKTLGEAFSFHPTIFTPLFVSMVEQGEEAGTLGESLLRLSEYYERLAGEVPSTPVVVRPDLDDLFEKVKPFFFWQAIGLGILALALGGLWVLKGAGLLSGGLFGPSICALLGAAFIAYSIIYFRYKPRGILRCAICGKLRAPAENFVPVGKEEFLCQRCAELATEGLRGLREKEVERRRLEELARSLEERGGGEREKGK